MSLRRSTLISSADKPRTVLVEIVFKRIGVIDIINEFYQAEVFIESSWIDNSITSEYDPQTHWNPKLLVKNIIQNNKEEVKYLILTDENQNTVITEMRTYKGQFWEKMELQNFPFDIQELSVEINSKYRSDEVILKSNAQHVSHIDTGAANTFIDQQKWKLFKFVRVIDDLDESRNNEKSERNSMLKIPSIKASTYCRRKPVYYIYNALLLIFLITVISLTIFSVDCKLPANRLQITITLLLTSVTFKWSTNRSLPTVSYLTSLDNYSIVCIMFLCALAIWHSLVGAFWDKPTAKEIDQWALVTFGCIFFLINAYFVGWIVLVYRKVKIYETKEKVFLRSLKVY